ncbi:hypothetical protein ACJJTC_008157 [Scirpophaga incertulas]
MSFEVDRCSAAWAHVALCADSTWTVEPTDEFIRANQLPTSVVVEIVPTSTLFILIPFSTYRLLTQHCRINKVLQEATEAPNYIYTHDEPMCFNSERFTGQNRENGSTCGRRSVKDVIPESRLARFYGNFYYDDTREKCYTNPNMRTNSRGYNGQGCDNSDLTECWMLPEVEYWFRKLVDDSLDHGVSRRRRQYRMLPDDDFERWDPARAQGDEAALAARVQSVRPLWSAPATSRSGQRSRTTQRTRVASPPPTPRKIRARRRQPRRPATLPCSPAYCLEVPAQLFCDPKRKFQFDTVRVAQPPDGQRAPEDATSSVQAAAARTSKRCLPYRGTNVCRYAPTGQRPPRNTWWPRDHHSNSNKFIKFDHIKEQELPKNEEQNAHEDRTDQEINRPPSPLAETGKDRNEGNSDTAKSTDVKGNDTGKPSTSTPPDIGVRKKRLYSTVLSMSAPAPLNLPGCVRLSQKLATPGLIKLNSKILMTSSRLRPANVDIKFEQLEKEALEQYKASDESIDTKFRELEKQAEEQYSASNSNTSCNSGNSPEKENKSVSDENKSKTATFHKDKPVDNVLIIYSQNFPDLNIKSDINNLKNFHIPRRGEKKEITHRLSKQRNTKNDSQHTASDTDYEAREAKHKGTRWSLPKKRHLTFCVSDLSSSDEMDDTSGTIKDAGPRVKNHASGKAKMSGHGAGDLQPALQKNFLCGTLTDAGQG